MAELVALVERMAAERRSVNQIVAAVRAFAAQPSPAEPAEDVWIACGSPEWMAWTRFRGRTSPLDRRGGWRFPSRWPPSLPIAAE